MRPINILILITSFAITFGGNWTDTTWAENPFMVRLQITINQRNVACGGSIVYKGTDSQNPGVILTAAHCVEGASNVLVIVGCTQSDCSDEEGVLGYNTNNYVVHPQYNSTKRVSNINWQNNDIALVYLEHKIYNEGARQVSLHSNINVLQNNANITIFGYLGLCRRRANCLGGSDIDTLEYAVTNYMISTECNDTDWGSRVNGPHDFCVKDDNSDNGLQSICGGDSGSPAFYEGSQIGINSLAPESCDPSYPTVLTSIPYYYEWIRSECPQCATASPTRAPTNVPTVKPTKRPTAPTTPRPTPKPYCISMWTFCGNRCGEGQTQIGKKTCWIWFGKTVSKRKCRTCYPYQGAHQWDQKCVLKSKKARYCVLNSTEGGEKIFGSRKI